MSMSNPINSFLTTHRDVLWGIAKYFNADMESFMTFFQHSLAMQQPKHHPLHNQVFYHLVKQSSLDFNPHHTESNTINLQRYKILRQTCQDLPLHCKKIIILMRLHGWSYRAISQTFDIGERTIQKNVKRFLFCCTDDLRLAAQAAKNNLILQQAYVTQPLKGRTKVTYHSALDWFVKLASEKPNSVDVEAFNLWVLHAPQHALAYAQLGELWCDNSLEFVLKQIARQVMPIVPTMHTYSVGRISS